MEEFKEIADSLCIGQKCSDGNEERVILFLKMASDSNFNKDLIKRLQVEIRTQLSARHVPALILPISDIPVCYFILELKRIFFENLIYCLFSTRIVVRKLKSL